MFELRMLTCMCIDSVGSPKRNDLFTNHWKMYWFQLILFSRLCGITQPRYDIGKAIFTFVA